MSITKKSDVGNIKEDVGKEDPTFIVNTAIVVWRLKKKNRKMYNFHMTHSFHSWIKRQRTHSLP